MREERVPKSKEEERPLEYGADRVSVTGRCQIFYGPTSAVGFSNSAKPLKWGIYDVINFNLVLTEGDSYATQMQRLRRFGCAVKFRQRKEGLWSPHDSTVWSMWTIDRNSSS